MSKYLTHIQIKIRTNKHLTVKLKILAAFYLFLLLFHSVGADPRASCMVG